MGSRQSYHSEYQGIQTTIPFWISGDPNNLTILTLDPDYLTILNVIISRQPYCSEYQGTQTILPFWISWVPDHLTILNIRGPRQPYHSEYHVQLGTQMTVGDVDFDDANVEDDSIDTVDCLGWCVVVWIGTQSKANEGQQQVDQLQSVQEGKPVPNFAPECGWWKDNELGKKQRGQQLIHRAFLNNLFLSSNSVCVTGPHLVIHGVKKKPTVYTCTPSLKLRRILVGCFSC